MPDVLSASAWQALMESVDYWPLAILNPRHLGVSPSRYPPSGVICERYPPPEELISHLVTGESRKHCAVDCSLGNIVGANG